VRIDPNAEKLEKSARAQEVASLRGMRVPQIVCKSHGDECGWIVEEFIEGTEFYPERFDQHSRGRIAADIGRQAALLHAFSMEAFGELRGDLEAQGLSWRTWLARQTSHAAAGLRIPGLAGDFSMLLADTSCILEAAGL